MSLSTRKGYKDWMEQFNWIRAAENKDLVHAAGS